MSSELIDTFMTETITVKRKAPGAWVKGTFHAGPETTVKIIASVQPMTPNEVIKETQASRSREGVKVFTFERLNVSDESNTRASDKFMHDGKLFEIISVSNWNIGTCLPHYESTALKVDGEGGGAP